MCLYLVVFIYWPANDIKVYFWAISVKVTIVSKVYINPQKMRKSTSAKILQFIKQAYFYFLKKDCQHSTFFSVLFSFFWIRKMFSSKKVFEECVRDCLCIFNFECVIIFSSFYVLCICLPMKMCVFKMILDFDAVWDLQKFLHVLPK